MNESQLPLCSWNPWTLAQHSHVAIACLSKLQIFFLQVALLWTQLVISHLRTKNVILKDGGTCAWG